MYKYAIGVKLVGKRNKNANNIHYLVVNNDEIFFKPISRITEKDGLKLFDHYNDAVQFTNNTKIKAMIVTKYNINDQHIGREYSVANGALYDFGHFEIVQMDLTPSKSDVATIDHIPNAHLVAVVSNHCSLLTVYVYDCNYKAIREIKRENIWRDIVEPEELGNLLVDLKREYNECIVIADFRTINKYDVLNIVSGKMSNPCIHYYKANDSIFKYTIEYMPGNGEKPKYVLRTDNKWTLVDNIDEATHYGSINNIINPFNADINEAIARYEIRTLSDSHTIEFCPRGKKDAVPFKLNIIKTFNDAVISSTYYHNDVLYGYNDEAKKDLKPYVVIHHISSKNVDVQYYSAYKSAAVYLGTESMDVFSDADMLTTFRNAGWSVAIIYSRSSKHPHTNATKYLNEWAQNNYRTVYK